MDSKTPVIIVVIIIVMGVLLWGILALRTAGGIDPERAKTLAAEAERECVLEGYGPERCPKLVGRHHRDCLEQTPTKKTKAGLQEKAYLKCMERAFRTETDGKTGASADAGTGEPK